MTIMASDKIVLYNGSVPGALGYAQQDSAKTFKAKGMMQMAVGLSIPRGI